MSEKPQGRVIPLRTFLFCCAGQVAIAIAMGVIGTIDAGTVIPACYFAVVNAVAGLFCSEQPGSRHD